MSEKVIIFVNAPRAGSVKRRLAQSIGPDRACHAYRLSISAILENLSGLKDVEVRYTPDAIGAEVKPWLEADWMLRPQGAGELSVRIQSAFQESFASGCNRVAIINCESPYVNASDIGWAWSHLRTHDVVLGPLGNGNVWLIGLRSLQRSFFNEVRWESDTLYCELLQRSKSAGLAVSTLRELSSVDTESEWTKFVHDKAADLARRK